ncbi:hypothetical protein LC040_06720 [Bacillus tianshenii]|nr:hypothetical protein LC040_06720 [Bacillus tianshenii]
MKKDLLLQLSRELLIASVELSTEISKKPISECTPTELSFLQAVDRVNEEYLNIQK